MGTSGRGTSSSPLSITFDFAPNFVIPLTGWEDHIFLHPSSTVTAGTSSDILHGVNMSVITTSFSSYHAMVTNNATIQVKKSSDGMTLYWYASSSSVEMDTIFNSKDITYYF